MSISSPTVQPGTTPTTAVELRKVLRARCAEQYGPGRASFGNVWRGTYPSRRKGMSVEFEYTTGGLRQRLIASVLFPVAGERGSLLVTPIGDAVAA